AGQAGGGMPGQPPGSATFNSDILKDPTRTLIAPYISGAVGIFKCAADPRTGRYNGTDPAKTGQTVPAARSVAMNQAVGTVCGAFKSGSGHNGKPVLAPPAPHMGAGYATFAKSSDFKGVSSSKVFLFVDESPWSINDGAFAVSVATPRWVDYPATYHARGCGFSFCDGHAEVHKWKGNSMDLSGPAGTKTVLNTDKDWQWMAEAGAGRR
ncbi:MAG TPA: hypothetical protein VN673_11520, partial [Clostridia bacterium]|nr:hypothetical protein [Clostridia bacterium]